MNRFKLFSFKPVIPAQAGILELSTPITTDPRLCGNDKKRGLGSVLKKIIRSRRGSAAVELALALPVLLLLGLGGFEMTRYILIQQKISKTVSSMSDLVSRSPSISEGELTAMFQAVPFLMEPYGDPADMVVIISSVSNYGLTTGPTSGTRVIWQRRGGGTRTDASRIGTATNAATMPFTLLTNENTIVAEIYYNYQPVVAPDVLSSRVIYKAKYNMPRLGALDVLRP